ncbi:MAG: hypothetical protein ACR2II_12225 [Chthoniobacterales bacterium]
MNKLTSVLLAGLAAGMVAWPSRGDQPITGPDGKINALIDRRNNEDIVWQKKASALS